MLDEIIEALPAEIEWITEGEPASASTSPSIPAGVSNRPTSQLYTNQEEILRRFGLLRDEFEHLSAALLSFVGTPLENDNQVRSAVPEWGSTVGKAHQEGDSLFALLQRLNTIPSLNCPSATATNGTIPTLSVTVARNQTVLVLGSVNTLVGVADDAGNQKFVLKVLPPTGGWSILKNFHYLPTAQYSGTFIATYATTLIGTYQFTFEKVEGEGIINIDSFTVNALTVNQF